MPGIGLPGDRALAGGEIYRLPKLPLCGRILGQNQLDFASQSNELCGVVVLAYLTRLCKTLRNRCICAFELTGAEIGLSEQSEITRLVNFLILRGVNVNFA